MKGLSTLLAGALVCGSFATAYASPTPVVTMVELEVAGPALTTQDTTFVQQGIVADLQEMRLAQLALDRSSAPSVRHAAQQILTERGADFRQRIRLADIQGLSMSFAVQDGSTASTAVGGGAASPFTSPANGPSNMGVGADEENSDTHQAFTGTIERPNPMGLDNAGFGRGTHDGYDFGSNGLGLNGGYSGVVPLPTEPVAINDDGDRIYNHFDAQQMAATDSTLPSSMFVISLPGGFSDLGNLQGATFDAAFIQDELALHRLCLAQDGGEVRRGMNAALKSLARIDMTQIQTAQLMLTRVQASLPPTDLNF